MNVDILTTTERIDEKIKMLEKARGMLREAAQRKSEGIGNYYKMRASVMVQLMQGVEFDIDGVKVKGCIASNAETIARGVCWKEAIERDLSESLYTNCVKGMTALQAELNGLQTKLKYIAD